MSAALSIGVALCTYNGQRYVGAQIESILAQTRRPDLLLVCDDASQDDTVARLQECAAGTNIPVRVICNEGNVGYVRNFEKAISLCDTDVIVLSDQDDAWRPDKLKTMEAALLQDARPGAVFSDAEIVDEQMRAVGYGLLDSLEVTKEDRALALSGTLLPVLLRRNIVAGATLAFRSAWRDRILPIPEGAIHDEWIALVLAAYGVLRFVPERLIQYRQHAANQIGARRLSIAERWHRLQRPRRTENERLLAMVRHLGERIRMDGSSSRSLAEIEGKIAHLERRVSLGRARLMRVPDVLAELATGRYGRYSSGWRAAVRDLVSPM